ncbi:MAG: PQQ-binding-like beta-propeller repeat protein [Kiritimatiellae bacterium]|nr:PQQ-binding-like beta-propeller repeat protein [Kiritimatiellia bacterium]MDD5522569.1 PQQ-binding-like beta-propeller repeat protein [Kiritimatiellia bacterium]
MISNFIFDVCLILSSVLNVAHGQEWTRFRGSNGSGLAEGKDIPVKWTEKDLIWKVTLPDKGHSSPILWGNRIFLSCADSQTAKRTLVCINAGDGATLWQKEYEGKSFKKNRDNNYAAASAATDAERVYYCWMAPDESYLLALDHDGKEIWKKALGSFQSAHGGGASPIVFEDMVILPVDQEGPESFIIAVDRATGQTRWKTPRKSTSAAASTPCIYQSAGKPAQVILSSRTAGVTGLDTKTGQLLWELSKVLPLRVVASPVVAGDLVLANCGTGGKGLVMVAIRPGDKDTPASMVYQVKTNAPYVPVPLVVGKKLFLWTDVGTVSCLEAKNGKVLWQDRLADTSYYSSPVHINGRIYNVSKRGEMLVISAGDKFELLGRTPLGEDSFATSAVAHGRLYIRTLTHLMCVGAKPK